MKVAMLGENKKFKKFKKFVSLKFIFVVKMNVKVTYSIKKKKEEYIEI